MVGNVQPIVFFFFFFKAKVKRLQKLEKNVSRGVGTMLYEYYLVIKRLVDQSSHYWLQTNTWIGPYRVVLDWSCVPTTAHQTSMRTITDRRTGVTKHIILLCIHHEFCSWPESHLVREVLNPVTVWANSPMATTW